MTTDDTESDRLPLLLASDLFRRGRAAAHDEGSRFSHGVAISLFHDAAEIAARTAAIKLRAPIRPGANFLEYWTEFNKWAESKNLPQRLLHEATMGDLNEARKYFKHRAKLMEPQLTAGYLATTHKFLVDTFREFFAIDFDDVSAVDFVRELRVKSHLEEALAALRNDDVKTALERCADAWEVTTLQQSAFFPSRGDHGITVTYDKNLEAILAATRGDFANILDTVHQLARLTFAALLGLNAGDLLLLIETLPAKRDENYTFRTMTDGIPPSRVRHVIELIADYSSALLRQIDGLTRPEWTDSNDA